MDDHDLHLAIMKMMLAYEHNIHAELKIMWDRWTIDLSAFEMHEVVGAILARQVTLAVQLARSPGTWNYHAAPLFLRAMTDNYITLAWICREPLDRSRKFILYGLGQAKLQNEHRKSQLQAEGIDPTQDQAVLELERWINSQRYDFLVEVNVGSWSGISTRKMAEDAKCLDFFNFVYEPFSAVTHNSWHHIARFNLQMCNSPLHRFHRIPIDPNIESDIELMLLGAKYMEKMLKLFNTTFSIERNPLNAQDVLLSDINDLNKIILKEKI